jgi:hypothetical protein
MLGACNIDASQEPLLQGLLKKWVVLTHKTKHRTYKVRCNMHVAAILVQAERENRKLHSCTTPSEITPDSSCAAE